MADALVQALSLWSARPYSRWQRADMVAGKSGGLSASSFDVSVLLERC